ncbi:hypothetical protein QVD17_09462 [Tagetes erecta]|uniref:Uncharacterized protein n=1 Tax=Tagetes erecta TaxID=13708 RepID=A0AAD8L7E0_TARER|nr:hypothetical protein QVD17_09462 [Tagetes erecta]
MAEMKQPHGGVQLPSIDEEKDDIFIPLADFAHFKPSQPNLPLTDLLTVSTIALPKVAYHKHGPKQPKPNTYKPTLIPLQEPSNTSSHHHQLYWSKPSSHREQPTPLVIDLSPPTLLVTDLSPPTPLVTNSVAAFVQTSFRLHGCLNRSASRSDVWSDRIRPFPTAKRS